MDAPAFPIFTPREHAADRVVHALGVAAAAVAVPLLGAIAASRGAVTFSGVLAYGLGAVAMFVASPLYNIAPPSPYKEILPRVDPSVVFALIPGPCTPFI